MPAAVDREEKMGMSLTCSEQHYSSYLLSPTVSTCMFARPDFQASEYSATGVAGQLGRGDPIRPKQLHVYAAALRHVPVSVCHVNTYIHANGSSSISYNIHCNSTKVK